MLSKTARSALIKAWNQKGLPKLAMRGGVQGLRYNHCWAEMDSFFERFSTTGTMIEAEAELVAKGEAAVPILRSLFSGEARNGYGIPYCKLGLPLNCAIHVAARLGAAAKPLEGYLRQALESGNCYAAMALRQIGSLDVETVRTLAASLASGDLDVGIESAVTLLDFGLGADPEVQQILSVSPRATRAMASAEKWKRKR